MKTPQFFSASSRRGFTLVELLTVVVIIVLLSALTVGAMGWVQKKAAIESTRAQIALIENGLERYYAATGSYPQKWDAKGLILYQALFGDGVGPDGIIETSDDTTLDGKPDQGATVYVPELDPVTNPMKLVEPGGRGARPTTLIDAFGKAFRYRGDGSVVQRNPDFDLQSAGPDGEYNTADDIKNW